ncbi:MAG: hypothetical protein V1492_00095 [Candidatus Micrarchaeota archaeon]
MVMMGLRSTSLSSEQKKDAKRDPLERKIKKKTFQKFKEILGRTALVTTLLFSGVGIYKCSDSVTDNPTTQTDTGNKPDVGELKDVGPKDAGPKDVGTNDAETEDASDGGPKDVETPDEGQPDVGPVDTGPADAGAEVETPDGGQINDGGNDTGQVTDGGETDAGVMVICDEYPTDIPAQANIAVPLDMFVEYCSGVPGFDEKVNALIQNGCVTDINGKLHILLIGVEDLTLPSLVRITSSEVFLGIAGVTKADGTAYEGLCGQYLGSDAELLNAAYQYMMSVVKIRK